MLKENLKSIEKEARQVIDKFIEGGDLHGCRRIDYKGDSEWYVCLDSADPWTPVLKSKGMSIVGNTIENLVLIADAITTFFDQKEYAFYVPVRVIIKGKSYEDAFYDMIDFFEEKGISTKDIDTDPINGNFNYEIL